MLPVCYNARRMSKTIADQLLDIVTAIRELPEEAQQELVHEMADRVLLALNALETLDD